MNCGSVVTTYVKTLVPACIALACAVSATAQVYPVLPHGFLENGGQWSHDVRFVLRRGGVRIGVERDGLVVLVPRDDGGSARISLAWDADDPSEPTGRDPLPGMHHVFRGRESAATGLRMYSGIDWGGAGDPQLDATPDGATLRMPAPRLGKGLRVEGATLDVRDDGALSLRAGSGELRLSRPGSARWQLIQGRVLVEGADPAADGTSPIKVDITWATFLGGTNHGEEAKEIVRCPSGDLIVVGLTNATDFPVTPGAVQRSLSTPGGQMGGDDDDAFVARLSGDGSTLLAATYLGGSLRDVAELVALCGDDVIVAGSTGSADFPVTSGVAQTVYGGGTEDGFIARLDASLSALVWTSYLGGTGGGADAPRAMYVRESGEVVLVGRTCSPAFPVTPGFGPIDLPECDGFVTQFAANGQLDFSGYIGGSGDDGFNSVGVTASGDIIVGGGTNSVDFPVTPGVLDVTTGPGGGVLLCIASNGSAVIWATFLMKLGAGYVDVLPDDTILVSGMTGDPDFPISPGAYSDLYGPGTTQPVLAWVAPDGSQFLFTTFWGEYGWIGTYDMALDSSGRITLVGEEAAGQLPTTPDAYQKTFTGGLSDGFVQVFDAGGTELLYGSYFSKPSALGAPINAVVRDDCGGAIFVGTTYSPSFPVTAGAFDPVFDGVNEAYIARMTVINPWTNLGGSLAGSNGTPTLTPTGDLCEGFDVSLAIRRGPSLGTGFLVLGASELSAPFKLGTLVPAPDLVVGGLTLSPQGALTLPLVWPPGLPSGLELWWQVWFPDAGGPFGFSSTNGVVGRTP
ncbi:MAG: hypothetical protein H6825_14920 [Planctomycetes bacterium]|nr:hypothetical protein [Planctomycetota bacterium]